eukprot:Skav201831  [mRNA]  locus=scaffold5003:30858:32117:- [translate_table: standard]
MPSSAQRSALDSGRDESTQLSEKEMALRNALLGTLQALKSSRGTSLDHRDVLLALNALGQIARAWDWLGSGRPVEECKQDVAELEQCAVLLCELANHELKLLDARQIAGKGDGFTTRDFALMLLALARIARRLRNSSVRAVLPGFAQELCSRLEVAAEHRDQPVDLRNLKEVTLEAAASLSAASLMLMHCAKDAVHGAGNQPEMNHSPSVPLAVIMAWSKTALHVGVDVRQESFKALAAATTMVMQQLSENTPLEGLKKSTDTLQFLLQFATGTASKDVQVAADMSEMDNWHLDSCLQALAVLDTLNEITEESLDSSDKLKRSRLLYLETCVIVEATSPTRLPKLQENNVAFWLRLLDSRLASRVATKLAFQLHECPSADRKKLPVAVRAALRDFLFFVEKQLQLPTVGIMGSHLYKKF